jgi:hypothetical protein
MPSPLDELIADYRTMRLVLEPTGSAYEDTRLRRGDLVARVEEAWKAMVRACEISATGSAPRYVSEAANAALRKAGVK